jgi:hypothetical protein
MGDHRLYFNKSGDNLEALGPLEDWAHQCHGASLALGIRTVIRGLG